MTAGLASAVILATVYLYGGLAKLRCPRLLFGTFVSLGLPGPISRALALALPWFEIIGGTLILLTDGWVRRLAIAVLTLVLVGGLVAAWRSRDEEVPCACLGPGDPTPLGTSTWVRNFSLLAASALVLLASPPALIGGRDLTAEVLAGIALASAATVLCLHLQVGLARQRATVSALPSTLNAMQQIAILQANGGGERLPRQVSNLKVHDALGLAIDIRTLTTTRTQVLIITEPNCGACTALMPTIPEMQAQVADHADVRVLSLTPLCAHPAPDALPTGSVFVQDESIGRAWMAELLAPGTPVGCVIREGLMMTHDALSDTSDTERFLRELAER